MTQFNSSLIFVLYLQLISGQKFCEDRQFPEDGQIFYIKYRGWKNTQFEDNWWYAHPNYGAYPSCAEASYLPKEKLLTSGKKYKWKWHDCGYGTAAFEYVGNGYSGSFWDDTDDAHLYDHPRAGQIPIFNCTYLKESSGDPCRSEDIQKHSKSDISNGRGYWKAFQFYFPQTCFSLKELHSHCNCGESTERFEFSQTIGISTTRGSQQGTDTAIKSEIQAAIKAAASGGFLGFAEFNVEASVGSSIGTEIAASFLSSLSRTWSQKTTRKIILEIPRRTCSTLYQAVAQYGEYNVEGTKTVKKERRVGRSCYK